MKMTRLFGTILSVSLAAASAPASSALITSTLGNDAPGFNDGDTPTVAQVGAAIGASTPPFNASLGSEIFGPDASATWTHTYSAIVDPILSATLTFGIVDHDSAASGSQLASFSLDGTDFTTTLDALFEAAGEGADLQYDVYTLTLPGGLFANLADGSAVASIALQGPGLTTPLFPLPGPNPPEETTFNGANLIFSSLAITTQDQLPAPAPAPPTLLLSMLGMGVLAWSRRRRTS